MLVSTEARKKKAQDLMELKFKVFSYCHIHVLRTKFDSLCEQHMLLNTESSFKFLNEKVSKQNYIKYFRHPSVLSICIFILAYSTKCPAF